MYECQGCGGAHPYSCQKNAAEQTAALRAALESVFRRIVAHHETCFCVTCEEVRALLHEPERGQP